MYKKCNYGWFQYEIVQFERANARQGAQTKVRLLFPTHATLEECNHFQVFVNKFAKNFQASKPLKAQPLTPRITPPIQAQADALLQHLDLELPAPLRGNVRAFDRGDHDQAGS